MAKNKRIGGHENPEIFPQAKKVKRVETYVGSPIDLRKASVEIRSTQHQAADNAVHGADYKRLAESLRQRSERIEQGFDQNVQDVGERCQELQRAAASILRSDVISRPRSDAKHPEPCKANSVYENAQLIVQNSKKLLEIYENAQILTISARKTADIKDKEHFSPELEQLQGLIATQEHKTRQDVAILLHGPGIHNQPPSGHKQTNAQELWDHYVDLKRGESSGVATTREKGDSWAEVVKRAQTDVRTVVKHLSDHESDFDGD